jgi:hypothetical protein
MFVILLCGQRGSSVDINFGWSEEEESPSGVVCSRGVGSPHIIFFFIVKWQDNYGFDFPPLW